MTNRVTGVDADACARRRRRRLAPRTGSPPGRSTSSFPGAPAARPTRSRGSPTPIIAEKLGVSVVVVNQPGASGAIGTQEVLNAPRDGLTWTANAIANNATYSVSGLLEGTDIDDWHIYLSVANAPLISVPADSEFKDFGQLLEAFRTRGEEITVATAGVTSSGGTAIAGLADAGGFKYRMVAYDGGGPAAIATAAGEAMVTTQLAVEQTELVRGGRLRPLAVMSDKPLVVEGVDPVPPVTEWLDMHLAPDYFGVFIPRGVPDEVVATVDKIWAENVMSSEAIRTYAETFGAVFDPSFGDDARARRCPSSSRRPARRSTAARR